MEIGLAILLFVCMTALLYVILSLKITRQVDVQMKEFYKTRIHSDMQEFYRDMEGYAALLERRIQQFKILVERNENAVRMHEAIEQQAYAAPAADEPRAEEVEPEPQVIRRRAENPKNKKQQLKAAVKAEAAKKSAAKSAQRAPEPVKKSETVKAKAAAAKPVTPARVAVRPEPLAPALTRQEIAPAIQRHYEAAPAAPIARQLVEDDSAIAEELMKDLYAQDEVQFSRAAAPVPAPQKASAPEAESESERSMSKFFSLIGKAVKPVVFGDKAKSEEINPEKAKVEPPVTVKPAATAANNKATADFAEVLRRAEQIKAEKKAERERAEVEARAEFYAQGDAFAARAEARPPTPERAQQLAVRRSADEFSIAPELPADSSRARVSAAMAEMRSGAGETARNTLAVKELDQYTIKFLIDSLQEDNAYRKQALRALTEHNIPLTEIARLSKIDIGELELMRQLGRF